MTGYESADYPSQAVGNIKVKKKKRKIQSGDYEVSEEEPKKEKVARFSGKDAESQKEESSQLTSSRYDMENTLLNDHKENRQRKKKHHHEDERSLVGNVSEHEISYNIDIDNTAVFEDIVHSEHTYLEGSARKKKKKKHRHKDENTLVENVSEHDSSHNKNITIDNTSGVGDHLHSEHTSLEESTKKKKKKRHLEDESTLVENMSEHISYSDKITDDNTAVFDDIVHSEHTNLEESTRKKKKKRHHEDESTLVENMSEHISYSDKITDDNTAVFDDIVRSEHTNLEESTRKKKKKRHHEDESTPVENMSEHISYSDKISVDNTAVFDDIVHSEHTNLEESTRKKKKKKHRHKDESTLVENVSEHEIPLNENMAVENTGVFGDHLHSEHASLEKSTRKKKKRHHKDESTLVENVSEHKISSNNIAIDKTDVSDVILHSEHMNLEESSRKKKKHRRKSETTLVENVSNYEVSDNENMAIDETNVSDDILHSEPNTLEEPVSKKKKKKHRLKGDRTLVGNVFEHEISYSETVLDHLLHAEHTNLTESQRKKKKKHRNVDGETCSNNNSVSENHTKENAEELAEPGMFESSQKSQKKDKIKRKSGLLMEETSDAPEQLADVNNCHLNEISTSEEVSLNMDAQGSVKKKKKKKHRQEEDALVTDTVVEDVLPSIETNNTEKASKKKKKTSEDVMLLETESLKSKKHDVHDNNLDQTKESECQTESSMNASFKQGITGFKTEDERSESTAESEMDKENSTTESTPSQKPSRTRRVQSTSDILCSLRKRDVKLLEEYHPQIWSVKASSVQDLITSDLGRIKEAKLKGIKYRTGKFDIQEDELIKKNVLDFVNTIGLKTPEILFHAYRFPEMKTTINKLKKQYHFMHRIAEGLYRNLHEVYERGEKLFDLSGKKGRFSREEVQLLRDQCKIHGKDWKTIAVAAGRSKKNTQLKASQLRREFNQGIWSVDEVNTLIQAVKTVVLKGKGKELVTVSKDMMFKGIPWTSIEEQVQTRNWTLCKSKWNDLMLMRMNDGISPFRGHLGLQSSVKIIQWLHDAEIEKEVVNWEELSNFVGNVPVGTMQRRVHRLKSLYVPHWRNLTFKEIVEYLYTEVLPTFEEKLDVLLQSQKVLNELPKRKDEFPIREIFREYSESEKGKKQVE